MLLAAVTACAQAPQGGNYPTPSVPAAAATTPAPVVQTVVITTTPLPTQTSAPTATATLSPTATSTPTGTPVPTSAPASPSASMPDGWTETEHGGAGSYNHDNDGDLNNVILTWTSTCAVRVTDDPYGEKQSGDGWAKYRWNGAQPPSHDQIQTLVDWRVNALKTLPGAKCTSYAVSWQPITGAPYTPKHSAQPASWTEFKKPTFAEDKFITVPVNLVSGKQIAIAWFWANQPGAAKQPDGCTMNIMTQSGSTTVQGGIRYFEIVNADSYTKDDLKTQVMYWKSVVDNENRGTCPNNRLIFQDSSMAF